MPVWVGRAHLDEAAWLGLRRIDHLALSNFTHRACLKTISTFVSKWSC